MKWLLLVLSSVMAQPSMPLLPTGITIDMVKQIQVNTGGVVQFLQATENSATFAHRLSYTPIVKFDSSTGILSINSAIASGGSTLQPGLLLTFLAALGAWNSNNKQQGALLCLLSLSMGVASANVVEADITIRVPGCFHIEGANNNILMFDAECATVNVTRFQGPAQPIAASAPKVEWEPITPATSFLPVNDHGQHYVDYDQQYEIWRTTFGRAFDETERQNFRDFTEECHIQNMDPDRNWTAACNQFAHLTHSDWIKTIFAKNAEIFAAANAGRRLLSEEEHMYSEISESHQRKLLQQTSFSWVGTGKLTPVKDQGACGSCYAHSATSQMEAQLAIQQGSAPRILSREQLKDCSTGYPGCDGGLPERMYQYAAGVSGLGSEADYPYVTSNRACKSPLPSSVYKNTGALSIAPNELAFKAALAKAPIAVTVCADTWNNYAGGLFTNCGNSQTCTVNHAVLLVGYGVDPTFGNYWLIQNSWNTWWGEAGFMRVKRTDASATNTGPCGLTRWAGYQANNPSGSGATPGASDCKGSWSVYSACTKTCGGGTQSRTWTTTAAPTLGGAPCPNPLTQTQTCNTALCGGGGGTTPNCLRVSNSVLGVNGDGDYKKVLGWNQNWCGTSVNPQWTMTKNGATQALFFYATNCMNGVKTAGMWGLGPATMPRGAYQWSDKVTVTNGVIPGPDKATGASWTLQFSAGLTCV
jgi:C1A family cysteine protease